jgi:curved DNA-binding protein CbpA
MDLAAMDYYVILGIPRSADAGSIRTAFRGLVRQYHPDAGAGSSAQRFREIVEAYETLSDPDRRRHYDATLRSPIKAARIEPLIRDWPEPISSHRPVRSLRVIDLRTNHLDPFDELFRSIERLFWDF